MSPVHSSPVLLAVKDSASRSALKTYFAVRGIPCEDMDEGTLVEHVRVLQPGLVVVDYVQGSKLLGQVRQAAPSAAVVALASDSAVSGFDAARAGASEMLLSPLDPAEMTRRLDALWAYHGGELQSQVLEEGGDPDSTELLPSSGRMLEIRDTINKVAATSATVLIRGESGVGKELVARMVYMRSDRRHRPFVKVNCAAIPDDLLESELFGYEQGAFTGALRSKPGKFELANGGTIFLDEIGEMAPMLQAKLLHVLQDGEFSRLGAKHDVAVDVRVICATNKVLEQRVAEGLFREDLFYRINVVTVHVPPLRERKNEIPVLVEHFLSKYSKVYRREVSMPGEEAMDALKRYSWPGNIRELENLCKRYVIVGDLTQILHELDSAPSSVSSMQTLEPGFGSTQPKSLLEIGREAAWKAEKLAIEQTLTDTRWNRKEAARRLQVSYKALLNKIAQMEKEREKF